MVANPLRGELFAVLAPGAPLGSAGGDAGADAGAVPGVAPVRGGAPERSEGAEGRLARFAQVKVGASSRRARRPRWDVRPVWPAKRWKGQR